MTVLLLYYKSVYCITWCHVPHIWLETTPCASLYCIACTVKWFNKCCYVPNRYSSRAARGRPFSPTITNGPPQCACFADLSEYIFPMLYNLGPYLSSDPILMAKVIRVGRAFLKEVSMFCVVLSLSCSVKPRDRFCVISILYLFAFVTESKHRHRSRQRRETGNYIKLLWQ